MSEVIRFTNYQPLPRDDGTPWTIAVIEQSPLDPIDWTTIEEKTLNPVDADPANPATRSFTTTHGTLNPGLYRIVFRDEADNTTDTEPLAYPAVDVIPDLAQIGAINRSRTASINGGRPRGTFTEDTRPTAAEAFILATLAAGRVSDTLGTTIPSRFLPRARDAAALYGAALVEGAAEEPRDRLIDMWNKAADTSVAAIAKGMTEVGVGGQEGPSDDAILPSYSFPALTPLPAEF